MLFDLDNIKSKALDYAKSKYGETILPSLSLALSHIKKPLSNAGVESLALLIISPIILTDHRSYCSEEEKIEWMEMDDFGISFSDSELFSAVVKREAMKLSDCIKAGLC